MSQSDMLLFSSQEFTPLPGEDESTNPGVFGKSLAEWLAGALTDRGMSCEEVLPEDFGWCLPISSPAGRLFVACANLEESTTEWRTFVFSEGGWGARLLGRPHAKDSVETVFDLVHECLRDNPSVTELRGTSS